MILIFKLVCAAALLAGSANGAFPPKVKIAAVFDHLSDRKHELAFRYGIERVNRDRTVLPNVQLEPVIVEEMSGSSFMAEKKVCKLLREGSVVAIFGPQTDAIAEHIKSITDMVEIPFIDTRWQYSFHNPIATYDPSTQYTVNLHPDVATIGQAYTDLAFRYGWDTVTILYEDNDSMSRLKEILDKTADVLFPNTFKLNLKKLVNTTENGYRDALKSVYLTKSTKIILDCSKDTLFEVMTQAQQIGMVSEDYFYLLTSVDAHTVDLSNFKYGGTNITAFKLLDNSEVNQIINYIVRNEVTQGNVFNFSNGNMDTEFALMYDAVHLFALSLHQLDNAQDVSLNALDCSGQKSWPHGSSLVNYMKLTEFSGLSGVIKFDTYGMRTDFSMEVLELQDTGLEPCGTWTNIDGLNMTREQDVTTASNPVNIMANKTFVVTLIENQPYTMLKEDTDKLEGNDRFEGYAIELMEGIAKILHFNVTFKLVDDGMYGGYNKETGTWDGMIEEVLRGVEDGGADFAVADLSITSDRAKAVTFSMPWMTLGISIVFVKPRPAPPSLLSFLSPFTNEVWSYTIFGYVFVSLVMFVLARLSPYEWDNPYPCIEEPEEVENMFSLANSFWFTIGSLMQQGSDVAPMALSTRLLAGVWFFFAMIVIASYTANLAAFLTVETLERPITSAEDLAAQTEIKYGVVSGGSTMKFFRDSKMGTYMKMWEFMSENREEVMVGSNAEGISKVVDEDGGYAFMMESSSIQYIIERNCKITQIGGNLDTKGYGIAMGNPIYKSLLDSAILKLQEDGQLHKMRVKWWKQKRGGGACVAAEGGGGVAELGLPNVAGVFIVTLAGCIFAGVLAFCEFLIGSKQTSDDHGTTWIYEMKEELKFAMLCYGSSKPVRKPLTEEDSDAGSEGSGDSGGVNSLERGQQSPAPSSRPATSARNPKSSHSSIENTYPKSNGGSHNVYGYGRRPGTKSPESELYGRAPTGGNPFESDKE